MWVLSLTRVGLDSGDLYLAIFDVAFAKIMRVGMVSLYSKSLKASYLHYRYLQFAVIMTA